MELWNLATNRYECKLYIVLPKNIKTFFYEIQFLPGKAIKAVNSLTGKKAYPPPALPTAY